MKKLYYLLLLCGVIIFSSCEPLEGPESIIGNWVVEGTLYYASFSEDEISTYRHYCKCEATYSYTIDEENIHVKVPTAIYWDRIEHSTITMPYTFKKYHVIIKGFNQLLDFGIGDIDISATEEVLLRKR